MSDAIDRYLARAGLSAVADPTAATDVVAAAVVDVTNVSDPESLYRYRVPPVSPDGSCGVGLRDEPYDLAPVCGLDAGRAPPDHPNTLRLARLHETVARLAAHTGVDWLGVYRRTATPSAPDALVKEAYVGAPSRAEFPLTASFAERSNNATVGLTGEAVLVSSVADHAGPYYECDARVQSELCAPLYDGEDVVGIVDAEAFEPDFFDPATVGAIAAACVSIPAHGLSTLPAPPASDVD